MSLNILPSERRDLRISYDMDVNDVYNKLNNLSSILKHYYMQYCNGNEKNEEYKCLNLGSAIDNIEYARDVLSDSSNYIYAALGFVESPRLARGKE